MTTIKFSDFMEGNYKEEKENDFLWAVITVAVLIASIKLGISLHDLAPMPLGGNIPTPIYQ